MKFSLHVRAALAVLSGTVGTIAALLPEDWIEQRFGFRPDGGDGSLELLWVATPLSLAAILALGLLRDRGRAESS